MRYIIFSNTNYIDYLDFDEDGGASDGIGDSIDYEVDDVVNALKNLILDVKSELVNEQEIVGFVERCMKESVE